MSKLYSTTRPGFALPYASEPRTRSVLTTDAENLPCMRWPNDHWCLIANLYLLELHQRGLSRLGIGGTLATYASNLGHLVRFCFDRGQDFHDLTDGQFTKFIVNLRAEKRADGERRRGDNHVLAIAANCLDFLEFVAAERGDDSFLGRDGRIKAYRRSGRSAGGEHTVLRWFHSSLPAADAKRRRHPIESHVVDRLRAAVLTVSPKVAMRRRRYVMLRCLEVTGGRRMELVGLKVGDVIAAIQSPLHRLRFLTVKRRGGKEDYRTIPCALNDLTEIWQYIRETRDKIIRATIGREHDHGFVFVNTKTGQPLRPNTVTQEIYLLAASAGLATRAAPHMFRHRYITKIFVAMIQEYDWKAPSDFRRALIGLKEIKQQLMEWTGHRNMMSLDHYIDLAFAEVEGLKAATHPVKSAGELDALKHSIDLFARELQAQGSPQIARRLLDLLARSSTQESPV